MNLLILWFGLILGWEPDYCPSEDTIPLPTAFSHSSCRGVMILYLSSNSFVRYVSCFCLALAIRLLRCMCILIRSELELGSNAIMTVSFPCEFMELSCELACMCQAFTCLVILFTRLSLCVVLILTTFLGMLSVPVNAAPFALARSFVWLRIRIPLMFV